MTIRTATILACAGMLATGCAAPREAAAPPPQVPQSPQPPRQPEPPAAPPQPAPAQVTPLTVTPPTVTLKEVFPGVRVDVAAQLLEIDATVPINARDPKTPRTYLEVMLCTPDTKEHESPLLTQAKASHIHAALLLLELEPGEPGTWDWQGQTLKANPPTGPALSITVAAPGQPERPIGVYALDLRSGATLDTLDGSWLFAGSRVLDRQGGRVYRADMDGTVIGLTTFGGETIAWSQMFNPDSGVEEPRWIANPATLPDFNAAVIIRIRPERR